MQKQLTRKKTPNRIDKKNQRESEKAWSLCERTKHKSIPKYERCSSSLEISALTQWSSVPLALLEHPAYPDWTDLIRDNLA